MRARDGVKLVSDVWMPADTGRWPAILVRTPLPPDLFEWHLREARPLLRREGIRLCSPGCPGRGDSDGEFDFFLSGGKDGYDAVEWIARQPWSNGRVCTMGVSYMGTVQWLAAREKAAPPGVRSPDCRGGTVG
jgi:putative CocE/NonD family hydrolase